MSTTKLLYIEAAASMSTSMELSEAAEISQKLCSMHQDTRGNVEHAYQCSPTALTIKFTNFDSIRSTTFLNNIFCHFGPLIEWKTELLPKTKGTRVVFQRRCNAETAFTNLATIFGTSLKSFRLKILPNTPKQGTKKRGRKRKIEQSYVDVGDC